MRRTKIICTIGPSSQDEDMLRKIILAGMNVARFNFSHGDYEEHGLKLERTRKISRELNLPVAVLLDTRGPEIRLRDFAEGKVELKAGQKFTLTTEEIMGTAERATITYKNLPQDVKPGDSILLDDGLIGLKVEEVQGDTEDVLQIREILKEHNSKIQIISKIESLQGIQNLEEIIEVSDGIMVARGDMGVEIPMEEVPIIQKRIIKLTTAAGKNVITATQMLDSMMKHPRPTRAEATDVANAIYDGTTGIMLSGETANGDYPLEAVQTMVRIAERAEKDIDYVGRLQKTGARLPQEQDTTTSICHATCTVATDLNAAAIIPVSMSGFTSGMVARFKPNCPIIACTTSRLVWRQMNLQWGVTPLLIAEENTAEDLFREAVKAAENAGLIKKGDKVVLTAGMPLGIPGRTNMLRVVEV